MRQFEMNPLRLTILVYAAIFLLMIAPVCFAQRSADKKPEAAKQPAAEYKSSAAYAEVLERKTELQANLESLLVEFTYDYPKVKEIKYTLGLLQKETDRLAGAKTVNATQMTLALGKLIVRKTELETDLWSLSETYKPEHPDVKRAKRKVEIYEAAIKEILG